MDMIAPRAIATNVREMAKIPIFHFVETFGAGGFTAGISVMGVSFAMKNKWTFVASQDWFAPFILDRVLIRPYNRSDAKSGHL
jgi:hypothetical protein